jgi:hypothetical protein
LDRSHIQAARGIPRILSCKARISRWATGAVDSVFPSIQPVPPVRLSLGATERRKSEERSGGHAELIRQVSALVLDVIHFGSGSDVSGLVVAPGFVDLHAHGYSNIANE